LQFSLYGHRSSLIGPNALELYAGGVRVFSIEKLAYLL